MDPWGCSCAVPNTLGQEATKYYPIVPKPMYERSNSVSWDPPVVVKPLVVKPVVLRDASFFIRDDPLLMRESDPLLISTSSSVYDRYVTQPTLHTPIPVYAESSAYETYPLSYRLNASQPYEEAMCYPSPEYSLHTDNHWSGVAQYW